MPLISHPHQFAIGAERRLFRGRARALASLPDRTPEEEALVGLSAYKLLVDANDPELVPDASVWEITLVEDPFGQRLEPQLVEAGPLYIRNVIPRISGLPTDHVEILAVALRGEV